MARPNVQRCCSVLVSILILSSLTFVADATGTRTAIQIRKSVPPNAISVHPAISARRVESAIAQRHPRLRARGISGKMDGSGSIPSESSNWLSRSKNGRDVSGDQEVAPIQNSINRKLLAIYEEEDPENGDEEEFVPDEDSSENDPPPLAVRGNLSTQSRNAVKSTTPSALSSDSRNQRHRSISQSVNDKISRLETNAAGSNQRLPYSRFSEQSYFPRSKPQSLMVKTASVEEEEQKVKNATLHLVIWLRDQLRHRLAEVANVGTSISNFEHLFESMEKNQTHLSAEREKEIKKKIQSQKLVADYRRKEAEPNEELRNITNQTQGLEKELSKLSDEYQALTRVHLDLQNMLHRAGFSHWLDARGNKYIPATAVGVLSKSSEILDPVVRGIGKAIEVDHALALDAERLLPIGNSAFFVSVVSDALVLATFLPALFVIHRLWTSMNARTLVDHIFYLSCLFSLQSVSCLLLSLLFCEEPLLHLQKTREPLLVVVVFATSTLYSLFLFKLGVLTLLITSRSNVMQFVLSLCFGYQFFMLIVKPMVLERVISFPVGMYAVYAALFSYTWSEKSSVTKCSVPFGEHVHRAFDAAVYWISETTDAMRTILSSNARRSGSSKSLEYSSSSHSQQAVSRSSSGWSSCGSESTASTAHSTQGNKSKFAMPSHITHPTEITSRRLSSPGRYARPEYSHLIALGANRQSEHTHERTINRVGGNLSHRRAG